MTIRQIKSGNDVNSQSEALNPRVIVHVETERPLIGEDNYTPQITVNNSSDTPITITHVELVTQFGTIKNRVLRPGSYPITVPVGRVVDVPVWFDLKPNYVKKTFEQTAELQIDYLKGNQEFIARASVQEASDDNAP